MMKGQPMLVERFTSNKTVILLRLTVTDQRFPANIDRVKASGIQGKTFKKFQPQLTEAIYQVNYLQKKLFK